MIKKSLIFLITLMTCSPIMAFESYIIIGDYPIKNYSVTTPNLLSIKRNITLYNDKTTLILTPQKEGKTSVDIEMNGVKSSLKVKVTKKSTEIEECEGLTVFELERPPEPVILDKPPTKLGGHK